MTSPHHLIHTGKTNETIAACVSSSFNNVRAANKPGFTSFDSVNQSALFMQINKR